jgi:hypothetical protein
MLAITSILHQKSIKGNSLSPSFWISVIFIQHFKLFILFPNPPPPPKQSYFESAPLANKGLQCQRVKWHIRFLARILGVCKMLRTSVIHGDTFIEGWDVFDTFGNLVSDWPATLCPVGPCPKECRKIFNFSTFLNQMQPTNSNVRTYVNGTDVETHGCAVTQNTLLKQFIWTVLYIFHLLPYQSSVDCGIWKKVAC